MRQSRDRGQREVRGIRNRIAALIPVLSCCLAALLPGPKVAAQSGQLTGVVIEQSTRRPIPSVSIVIVGSNRSALTDSIGSFSFTNLSAGQTRVRVSHVAYRTGEIEVSIRAAEVTDAVVTISETAVRLDS